MIDALRSLQRFVVNPTDEHAKKARSIIEPPAIQDPGESHDFIEALGYITGRFGTTPRRSYLDTYLATSFKALDFVPQILSIIGLSWYDARVLEPDSPTRALCFDPAVWSPEGADGIDWSPGTVAYFRGTLDMVLELDGLVRRSFPENRLTSPAVILPKTAAYIKTNRHEGILWFDRDRFGDVVSWLAILEALQSATRGTYSAAADDIIACIRSSIAARNGSEYRVDELLRLLKAVPGESLEGDEGAVE